MPAFNLLSERELDNLVSYVIHLSMRGELEISLIQQVLNKEIGNEDELFNRAMTTEDAKGPPGLVELITKWSESETAITPDKGWFPTAEKDREQAVREGFKLFFAAGCTSCHTDFGRSAQFQYDVWGTLVRPINLTTGVYRGGRRPIDLYWRIRSGIIVMPGFDKNSTFNVEVEEGGKKVEKKIPADDKKIGQLVAFLQALPYPKMLPDDLREQIYGIKPQPREKAKEH